MLVIEDGDSYEIWTEDPSVRVREVQDLPIEELDLEKIVGKMLNVDGLEIKNRPYKLKVYPRCFIGSEAVAWLQEHLKLSQEKALSLGQRLIDEKWMHHVTDDHPFKDDYLFYRFYRDE